ncbi:hemolysin family protein [Cocleimonas flava]|uniref:Magnesium and cobalt efflux protein CorC n=1 Tax=Cocleimonas flava TaxID=634765 RepID=A0A4R1F6W4_9GAMM|nr:MULTISPECIES: hemolysin family protein [Cocleimonas]MEB8431658.1 hemolysin family protein [Cocleimonas sp. KMM 6892]MEC4713570.1 hemolysin family protein [Cocleimonas sp. KMM 6895]MEC4742901.1 hemolysin family protein [Cocleimonas sp. KMM 6896]TCJ89340.1 CBS domain containing-hemolysin-like protein [Cocleimonas flava]
MDHGIFGIVTIVLLLAINAFFVAAEFALVKAKSFRINLLADQGSKSALLTQRIQNNLESYLAACQLGITMASLGLGWVGEPVVAALLEPVFHTLGVPEQLLHPISFILGFLIFSSLHIVVGEQVPKTFAIRKAEPVSMWTAYPLHWFYLLAYPLNWLLNKASGSILALFNVEEATHADVLSDDEIRGIIDTSEKHGDLTTDKAAMLQNMFEFDSHTVEQIMLPQNEVDGLDLQLSWEENLKIIRETQHSRFPVFDGDPDTPVGILLVKDLYNVLIANEDNPDPMTIIKDNVREALLVPETQPITNLLESMRGKRSHMALVMDEYGSFSGVVTMEDMLEEIVGEIADEMDIDEPDAAARWVVDHWETDGLVSMMDLERVVNINFPDEVDANTITGLFMTHLSRMPRPGDEIEQSDLRFLALDVHSNRVGKVQIYPLNDLVSPNNQTDEATPEAVNIDDKSSVST